MEAIGPWMMQQRRAKRYERTKRLGRNVGLGYRRSDTGMNECLVLSSLGEEG